MSVLNREALLAAMNADSFEERLIVTPILDTAVQIGPSSIDLRLDSSFILFRRSHLSGVDPQDSTTVSLVASQSRLTVPYGSGIWVHPGEMVLGGSVEFLRIPDGLFAYVTGRSTWGRLGLIVATAILIHAGYSGGLTLELVNTSSSPLKLYPGMRVAQLSVHRAEGGAAPTGLAASQYAGATRAQAPRQAWTENEMHRIRALGHRLAAAGTAGSRD